MRKRRIEEHLRRYVITALSVVALGASGCAGGFEEPSTAPDAAVSPAPEAEPETVALVGACAPLPSGTKVLWSCDATSAQSSGSAPLIYDGDEYVPGKIAQACHFNGVNYATLGIDSVTCANVPDCGLAAWIRRPPGGTAEISIMNDDSAARHFEFKIRADGKVVYRVLSSPPVELVSTIAVDDDVWHHVVLNHVKTVNNPDGSTSGPATFYIDSVQDGSPLDMEYSTPPKLSAVNSLAKLPRPGPVSDPGLALDDVFIGRALTPTKITDIWTSASFGLCKPSGHTRCGNGVVENSGVGAAEECDDSNLTNGDGCNDVCQTERTPFHGIVSRWRLDLGSGTIAHDRLTPTSPEMGPRGTILPGSPWSASTLPGFAFAGGSMTTGSSPFNITSLPDRREKHVGTGPLMAALWVNVGTTASRDWFTKTGLLPLGNDIKLSMTNSGTGLRFIAGQAGTNQLDATVPTLVGAGWKHLAAAREADGTLRLYVDCVEVASAAGTPANVTNLNNITGTSGPASQIQDVTFLNVALPAAKLCLLKDGTYTTDADGDGLVGAVDNCPADTNADQLDADGDGEGDVCDSDDDNDGVSDGSDNCPFVANADQTNTDGDTEGDACDFCPEENPNDQDGDTVCAPTDTCPLDPLKIDPGQCGCGMEDIDSDGDGTADCNDECDTDPNKTVVGACGCGVADTDTDSDTIPDCIDVCPEENPNDQDGDGTCAPTDECPLDPLKLLVGACGCGNPETGDSDGDGLADCVDNCPLENPNDQDGDTVCAPTDTCPTDPFKIDPGQCGCNAEDTDSDGDGTADCLDGCPFDPFNDADTDLVCGDADNCPLVPNSGQENGDGDLEGDACDTCPLDAQNDADMDGVCGDADNCPLTPNASQADGDNDGVGDVCDNCPLVANPTQSDGDNDGIGDACELPAAFASYAFNAGSGTVAVDGTGNGHTGTIHGATWVTPSPAIPGGSFGKALQFNGTNQYVGLANVAIPSAGSASWSAWVYATGDPADDGQIVAKANNNKGWQLKTSPDAGGGHRFAVLVQSSASNYYQVNSNTIRTLNTWYHVAAVFDKTAHTLHLYVNGVLDDGPITNMGPLPAQISEPAVDAAIGRRNGGFYFKGRIDNVRIYTTALTPAQILADMNTPAP